MMPAMFSAIGWVCVEESGSRDEFGDERGEPTPQTHRNHRHEWPMRLFEEVGRIASGSFGFLHVWDDATLRPVAQRWFAPSSP